MMFCYWECVGMCIPFYKCKSFSFPLENTIDYMYNEVKNMISAIMGIDGGLR
jgi:hypothetical protein